MLCHISFNIPFVLLLVEFCFSAQFVWYSLSTHIDLLFHLTSIFMFLKAYYISQLVIDCLVLSLELWGTRVVVARVAHKSLHVSHMGHHCNAQMASTRVTRVYASCVMLLYIATIEQREKFQLRVEWVTKHRQKFVLIFRFHRIELSVMPWVNWFTHLITIFLFALIFNGLLLCRIDNKWRYLFSSSRICF